MRRVVAVLATSALVLAVGCGGRSYDVRLEKTLENMRYNKRLNDNLGPAPTKGKLEASNVFVRPPKSFEPSKEFQLTVLEPGKFDISESFFEAGKSTMHVLGRLKLPKAAPKKGAAPPPEPVVRGDFKSDVLALLGSVYNVDLEGVKAKDESKKNNKFKHYTFDGNGKNVQVYMMGEKNQPYEMALIFEYPKSEQAGLTSKIELCLESFATGERAKRNFTGGSSEEETAEGASGSSGAAAF